MQLTLNPVAVASTPSSGLPSTLPGVPQGQQPGSWSG
jgi:hypothetical protein